MSEPEKQRVKRLGILTSGGDCPGLNAVIRAATARAAELGIEMYGIMEGTLGLLERPLRYVELDPRDFTGSIMRQAGTMLGTTNRGNPFAYPMPDGSKLDRSEEIIEGYHMLGLDGLIVVGGDGSMAILRKLAQQGNWNIVTVPKTIDNDIGKTEVCLGFGTVVDVATEALDRLQPTAASHARVMVLEVMGRDAGHIALQSGIAGGADVILIPEIPYSLQKVVDKVKQVRAKGRNFALVVVSEAVRTIDGDTLTKEFTGGEKRLGGIGAYVSERIATLTGAETRVTVLGHVQRGAPPNSRDRIAGATFGVHAVDLCAEHKFDRMVSWSERGIIDVPIEDAISAYHSVELDGPLVHTARAMGICLGD